MLQVLALSTIIQAEIRSVYPVNRYAKSLYSGTVQPNSQMWFTVRMSFTTVTSRYYFLERGNCGDLFVPNNIVPLLNIKHDRDPIGNHSDDSNTKQTGNNNVANKAAVLANS